ncbi:MAG: cupin domain-containing protein [Hyphomicrobiales bacterium]|jgi:quercetin dioxygenase-like cupin family protein
MKYPPIHIRDVPIAKMEEKNGWNISEFRLPITGETGSSTTVFHSIFKPGSTHSKHLHSRCPEIAMYLKGHGVVGQGAGRTNVRAGHFRVMPANSEHFFHNETKDSDAEVIGFYIGAKDVEDTGYKYCGPVTEDDLNTERAGFSEGILVHIDDVEPEKMDEGDGWSITDFRLPISKKNGSTTTVFNAKFMPGAIHKKHMHTNCEEIYYIVSGRGIAGAGGEKTEIEAGHFHYIPKGVEHWLYNTSDNEPIHAVGLYIGSGSVEETGYVYLGDVTEDDITL